MKPTPGPWALDDDSQRIDGIGTVHAYRVLAQNGDVVAEFSSAGCNEIVCEDDGEGDGRHYDRQAMANATLIAAAPEMADEIERLRAALQAILAVNDGERVCAYSWGQEYYKRSFDIAAKALQQATVED
jgi:hypothetical protein